jgi:ADP-heptose:LPS heptosyltransferase
LSTGINSYLWSLIFRILAKVRFPNFSKKKKILIVRLDGLGDYVIFRNSFEKIYSSEKYSEFEISFLGNVQLKELAEYFEQNTIKKFIWVRTKSLSNNFYLLGLILRIKFKSYSILINPVHSRKKELDFIINMINAEIKICSSGDPVNYLSETEFAQSTKLYNHIIKVPNELHFEFDRNQIFLKKLLNENLNLNLELSFNIKQERTKYFLVVPGANSKSRMLNSNLYAVLINEIAKIEKFTDYSFVFTGAKEEIEVANEIISKLDSKVNTSMKVGEIKLNDLVDVIGNASMVISNETGTVHIAAATKTKCICFSNGNHFGRFHPYPQNLSFEIKTFYPNSFPFEKSNDEIKKQFSKGSTFDINQIDLHEVILYLKNSSI